MKAYDPNRAAWVALAFILVLAASQVLKAFHYNQLAYGIELVLGLASISFFIWKFARAKPWQDPVWLSTQIRGFALFLAFAVVAGGAMGLFLARKEPLAAVISLALTALLFAFISKRVLSPRR